MPWVRFDDNTSEDPKIDHLTDGAFRLWFNAICFANRNLTDGYVPNPRITRLAPNYRPAHLNQLVDAGLFHKENDGITIHGYLRYQLSAEEIQNQRERERQKKARQRAGGYRKTGRDTTSGQFMSPGDNDGDSPGESGGESPATHPTPPPTYRESSSSEPCDGPRNEEEEDFATTEAKRRLANRTGPPVTNPEAWIRKTAAALRLEHYAATGDQQPAAHPANNRRPDCPTCDGLSLIEVNGDAFAPCPDCTRSATA